MANPEHLAILKRGVEVWNKWREDHKDVVPNLRGANLSGSHIGKADLRGANITEAHLIGVELRGANLYDANLSMANLWKADLRAAVLNSATLVKTGLRETDLRDGRLNNAVLIEADLRGADLSGAELREANLRKANLSAADLCGADLWGVSLSEADVDQATVSGTLFADIDLSNVAGLETVKHIGPSPITVGTINKSNGNIPDAFLRGCGVPDDLIGYIKSIAGAIQYYSCFISYSTKDQEFADRLYADLQAKGVRCWFAPHDIRGGRKIHEQLDDAIRLHDKLLLILSEHSMASDWVGTEVANAREREAREKRQMLYPLSIAPFEEVKKWKLFDADRGKDSAREIREYFIPDFSNWKDHDSYQNAFTKLVADLKADGR